METNMFSSSAIHQLKVSSDQDFPKFVEEYVNFSSACLEPSIELMHVCAGIATERLVRYVQSQDKPGIYSTCNLINFLLKITKREKNCVLPMDDIFCALMSALRQHTIQRNDHACIQICSVVANAVSQDKPEAGNATQKRCCSTSMFSVQHDIISTLLQTLSCQKDNLHPQVVSLACRALVDVMQQLKCEADINRYQNKQNSMLDNFCLNFLENEGLTTGLCVVDQLLGLDPVPNESLFQTCRMLYVVIDIFCEEDHMEAIDAYRFVATAISLFTQFEEDGGETAILRVIVKIVQKIFEFCTRWDQSISIEMLGTLISLLNGVFLNCLSDVHKTYKIIHRILEILADMLQLRTDCIKQEQSNNLDQVYLMEIKSTMNRLKVADSIITLMDKHLQGSFTTNYIQEIVLNSIVILRALNESHKMSEIERYHTENMLNVGTIKWILTNFCIPIAQTQGSHVEMTSKNYSALISFFVCNYAFNVLNSKHQSDFGYTSIPSDIIGSLLHIIAYYCSALRKEHEIEFSDDVVTMQSSEETAIDLDDVIYQSTRLLESVVHHKNNKHNLPERIKVIVDNNGVSIFSEILRMVEEQELMPEETDECLLVYVAFLLSNCTKNISEKGTDNDHQAEMCRAQFIACKGLQHLFHLFCRLDSGDFDARVASALIQLHCNFLNGKTNSCIQSINEFVQPHWLQKYSQILEHFSANCPPSNSVVSSLSLLIAQMIQSHPECKSLIVCSPCVDTLMQVAQTFGGEHAQEAIFESAFTSIRALSSASLSASPAELQLLLSSLCRICRNEGSLLQFPFFITQTLLQTIKEAEPDDLRAIVRYIIQQRVLESVAHFFRRACAQEVLSRDAENSLLAFIYFVHQLTEGFGVLYDTLRQHVVLSGFVEEIFHSIEICLQQSEELNEFVLAAIEYICMIATKDKSHTRMLCDYIEQQHIRLLCFLLIKHQHTLCQDYFQSLQVGQDEVDQNRNESREDDALYLVQLLQILNILTESPEDGDRMCILYNTGVIPALCSILKYANQCTHLSQPLKNSLQIKICTLVWNLIHGPIEMVQRAMTQLLVQDDIIDSIEFSLANNLGGHNTPHIYSLPQYLRSFVFGATRSA